MTARKMAVLRLNAPTLRKLLDLPAEAEIVRIDLERFVRGEVHIVVHGVGDEVAEGMPLPPARDAIVTTRTNDSGTVVGTRMDWGLQPTTTEIKPLWSPRFRWTLTEGSTDRIIAGGTTDSAEAAKDAAEKAGLTIEESPAESLRQRTLRVWCGAIAWRMDAATYPSWVMEKP